MSLTPCTGEDLRRNLEITESRVCRAASRPGGLQAGSAWPARGFLFLFFYLKAVTNMEPSEDTTSKPVFPASVNIRSAPARATFLPGNNQRKQSSCQSGPGAGPQAPQEQGPRPPQEQGPRPPATHTHDLPGPQRRWRLRPRSQSTPPTHPSFYKGKLRPRREACLGSHSRSVAEPG